MKTMTKGLFARLLTLILALMLAGMSALPALAGEENYTATVTGGALRLRAKPQDNGKVLGRYKSGTVVILLADGESYCKVRTPDGKEGYMMKSFLDIKNGLPPMEAPTPTPAPDRTREEALARGIDPAKPMLALTFDDGPSPTTTAILDALQKNGARATFFILGQNIAGNEPILQRAAQEGHQLCNHSWSHPHLDDLSSSAVRSQMTRTGDKITEVTGQTVTMMRPPFGAMNRLTRRVITELELPVILWKIDTLDWKTKNAAKTAQAILSGAGNGVIILCHDTVPSTAQALETALPQLVEKGYQLVTVSEMMSFRNEPLRPGWEYSHLDPRKIDSVP
ncbi:MAG: polysaccharide deacetylase family protein [Christensenellales bacterium]